MMRRLDMILADVIEQLGIEGAGRAGKSADPRAESWEDRTAAIRLVVSNTTIGRRTTQVRRPMLAVVR